MFTIDKYIFPARFVTVDNGYSIDFPDLPGCISWGDTLENSLKMSKEALELHLWGMEDDNEEIPNPSLPQNIEVEKGEFIVPIEVYMPPVRDEMRNKAVKKTLTIPYWLDEEAKRQSINFSQVLQFALKEKLGIKER
ncbi:type II toxin-antitoxin system HicB family antitoxin [Clostridium hydrogeniformans]|uniref:type II toxin-antitoxin system HicB family antitoxin n=1 Tax=Clostridium hydrogeniformans TaxID=349933 RepID=UPI000B025B13